VEDWEGYWEEDKFMKIVSGSSNKPLAEKIAKNLNTSLSGVEIFVFPDKERRIRILDKVLDSNCAVVQAADTPADQKYMELFFLVDGLKRSGAESVTAVIPYLGYQRQDHIFREGEAVSLQVIVETLEAVGVDKIITVDLHTIKIPELFKIPIIHLSALSIFAEKIKEIENNLRKIVLVSPDMGGIRRIKILSEMLGNCSYATINKDRDLSTGTVSAKEIEGEVDGKIAIIVDDMISTGNTILTAAKLLKEKGAEKIYVFATHGIFSDDAGKNLQNNLIGKVFVTDSVFISKEKCFEKLEVLTISTLIANNLK